MKYAIISDIHSNLEALKTVLDYIHSQSVDQIICLGDVVGYGPRPNECIELIRNECHISLMGNHDHAVLGLMDISYFNQFAKDSVIWTQGQIKPENLDYLKNMPFTYESGDILFVHSTPDNPEDWDYILSTAEARASLNRINYKLVFVGHSHVPVIFSLKHGQIFEDSKILNLGDDKYIVNVGSVGQPRNKDPRSCFVLFDDSSKKLQYIRLEYNVKTTYHEIIENKLPAFLAVRLLSGF